MDPRQVVRGDDGVMRCRVCGFRYGLNPREIVERSETGLDAVEAAVAAAPEGIRRRRPEPAVWSVNAYTSHLADAATVILGRTVTISEQDEPSLAYHDQDQAVEESRADERPVDESLVRLRESVREFQRYVAALPPDAWDRVGVHERAGRVRLTEIAHDMPHELQHHAGDIRDVSERLSSSGGQ